MADVVSGVNQKIVGYFTGIKWANAIGWLVVALLVIGAILWALIYYKNKRLFNKTITAFEIVGINYVPSIRDKAKVVKIGSGGFEILFLKKLKTWKLSYGGKVGTSTYYFFIGLDGYWYNGMLSAKIHEIDKLGGLIPIVSTNPAMRAQYTSLEKQIETLHGEKSKFWDKYGMWILSLGFVLVAGVMLWLCYKEFVTAMGELGSVVDKLSVLIDKLNLLSGNIQSAQPNGLIPAQ